MDKETMTELIKNLQEHTNCIIEEMNKLSDTSERGVASIKFEEFIMWLNKAIDRTNVSFEDGKDEGKPVSFEEFSDKIQNGSN